jgi:hypothetical protein
MEDSGSISIASISAAKQQQVADQASVSLFKKALKQNEAVTMTLVEGATKTVLPDGVGQKVNTAA